MNIGGSKKRKFAVAITICAIILVTFILLIFQRTEDPLNHSSSREILCERILAEIEISDQRFFIIYLNRKGNLACAMYEKDVFKKKYLFVSSEVAFEHAPGFPNVLYTAYVMDYKPYWMVWGVVDDDVTEVTIGGVIGSIVVVEDTKVFYCIDQPGNIPSTDSFEFVKLQEAFAY